MSKELTLSIIIPTLNAERTMGLCLDAIISQDYPKEKIEIIVADAGSTDETIKIIHQKLQDTEEKVKYQIFPNPLKTGEAGKAVGIRAAGGDIIALIDSDNIFESHDSIRRLMEPFADDAIMCSEVLYWSYRREDSTIDRYCALTGINNPMCLFLGNYDRYSYLTNRWTGLPLKSSEDCGNYLKVTIDKDHIPTMGANGFMIRRSIVNLVNYGEYYFDIDVVYDLIHMGHDTIARPKIGIIHFYCDNLATFIRKQKRCIRDYLYYKKINLRTYEYKLGSGGFAKYIIFTVLIFPLVWQSWIGYRRKPDSAWFMHPLLCLAVLFVYGTGTVKSFFHNAAYSRKNWRQ